MNRLSTAYAWTLLAPAVLPLLYVSGMLYPLMTPKTLAFRGLGIVAVALFAYLALSGKPLYLARLRERRAWVPAALLAVAYLTSIVGTDFYRSFWSTFERGDGLLTLTVAVGYFYLILVSVERSWLPKLFRLVAWVGMLAAAYLVLQWLGAVLSVRLPFILPPSGRVGGTLGNAAFFAAYAGMALFATLSYAREAGKWKRLFYAGAALEVVAIILSATRGTLLALAVLALLGLVYRVLRRDGARWPKLVLGGLVVAGGAFFLLRAELARVPFEPIQRIASVSVTDATVASRLFIWENVSREALPRALTGYGAEHIDVPFDRVYDPSQILETWFDRTHNAYLDYFVQYGILGILLYLLLVAGLVHSGWRAWRRNETLGLPVLAIALVYAMQNFFVFDTAVTLWFLLALYAGLLASEDRSAASPAVAGRRPFAWTAAVLLLLLYPVVIQPARANVLAFRSYQYQVVDVPRSVSTAQRGLASPAYADLEYGYTAYVMYTENQLQFLSGEALGAAYRSAVQMLSRAFRAYPYDARTAVYLAQVIASAPAGEKPDSALLGEAIDRAMALSPKRPEPWFLLANITITAANMSPPGTPARLSGYASAVRILRKYESLVPDLSATHFILAQLERAQGHGDVARQEAAKGRELYRGELTAARRAVAYYESVEDFESAALFLRDIVREAPGDLAARYELAKLLYILGDPASSLRIVLELRALDPAIIDTDPAFKAAIESYEQQQ